MCGNCNNCDKTLAKEAVYVCKKWKIHVFLTDSCTAYAKEKTLKKDRINDEKELF